MKRNTYINESEVETGVKSFSGQIFDPAPVHHKETLPPTSGIQQ
jgi:hypothetical protein